MLNFSHPPLIFAVLTNKMRRRYVSLKYKDSVVQVICRGGMFKARFAGGTDVAFGVDEQQAVQRLHKLPNMVRSVCLTKHCDVAADRAERRAESAVQRAPLRRLLNAP
jgi:hypothetical protein